MQEFLKLVNAPVVYLMAAGVISVVLIMALYFGLRAWRRGIEIGMEPAKLRGVITSSAVFTVVPSVSILLGLITMAGVLGVPLPWVRLSVIGSVQYELIAADSATKAAGVAAGAVMDMSTFVTVALVMTTGIIWGLLMILFFLKKYTKGVNKVKTKDNKWGTILFSALFMGLVCAFLGSSLSGLVTGNYVSIVTLGVSALFMGLCMLISNKFKIKWLDNFALSISMIGGMAAAALTAPLF